MREIQVQYWQKNGEMMLSVNNLGEVITATTLISQSKRTNKLEIQIKHIFKPEFSYTLYESQTSKSQAFL